MLIASIIRRSSTNAPTRVCAIHETNLCLLMASLIRLSAPLIRYGKPDVLAALIAFDPGTLLAQVIAI